MSTIPDVDTGVEIVPFETGDPSLRSHYVRPADNGVRSGDDPTTARDIVDLARLGGYEVVALCGYRWIPQADPKKHPICEACIDVGAAILGGERP